MTGQQRNSNRKVNGKFWRLETSQCGGRAVLRTPSDEVCPSGPFLKKSQKNEILKLKPGNRKRGNTINNIDILTLDVCLPPRIFISLAMISNNKLFQNFTQIPELSPPISTTTFSSGAQGGWCKWQNEFWQNLELTLYLLEMKWSPHAGSHFSQTSHGIARLDYQLVDLHALLIYYVLIKILMNLSASNDVSMIFQGTVEDRN